MSQILAEEILSHLDTYRDYPKTGVIFKDISGLFRNPLLMMSLIDDSVEMLRPFNPDVIYGIESRGFLFGVPMAMKLGVPFEMIRKIGKLPGETISESYSLEYGQAEIEIQKKGVGAYHRAVIVDDVLATGGTALAAAQLLEKASIGVVCLYFMAEIADLKGREVIEQKNYEIISLAKI